MPFALLADAVPVLAALTAGVVHTILGPDHYLPLIALAKERRWRMSRALGFTVLAGLLHCAMALLVVLAGTATLHAFDVWRGDSSAWLLLGLGIALLGLAWRHRKATTATTVGLMLFFVLGPCEWLVPATLTGDLGVSLTLGLVFTLATIATMTAAVAVGLGALRSFQFTPRASTAISGGTCVACALALFAGL